MSTYAVHVGSPGRARVEHVADGPPDPVRETWDDTNRWYPALLAAGRRVERSHDLRLSHVLLRRSRLVAGTPFARRDPGPWDELAAVPAGRDPSVPPQPVGLFELGAQDGPSVRLDPVAELRDQLATVAAADGPDAAGRLRLLLAGESAGALVAAEMHHAGVPWRADVHDAILSNELGPRPRPGERPARMEELVARIRAALDAPPTLNPDSHPDLLKALQYAGVGVRSLRKGELERTDHPVVEPLLEYKKLARLLTANGWAWLDTWVHDGRFRTEYVVGGVVTGRWASSGGERCSSRSRCGAPSSQTRAGGSSWPTPRSSSRACSPGSRTTSGWPPQGVAATCTRGSSRRAPSRPATTRRWGCSARCTAARRATARSCSRASRRRSPTPSASWSAPPRPVSVGKSSRRSSPQLPAAR